MAVFLHGNGGSNPMSFKVVAYATEEEMTAAKPNDNTIGVITDKKITGYYFSATQPESASEGEVYFNVGTTSPIAFNALKKNTLMVYPVTAKQYVSGAWVDVKCKTYKGDKWADFWNGELYKTGNEYTGMTGGWVSTGMGIASGSAAVCTSPTITLGEASLTMHNASGGGAVYYTAKKIDLRPYTKLVFEGSVSGASGSTSFCNLYVWKDFGKYYDDDDYYVVKQNIKTMPDSGQIVVDISGCDDENGYYVGFGLYAQNPTVIMYSMVLE